MKVNSALSVVIPVFIKNPRDQKLLEITINKVSKISSDIILISQGLRPKINKKVISNYHFNESLGKWKAIEFAKRFKLKEHIFLHDGDDPFHVDSYISPDNFFSNSLINRDKIDLYANDQISKNSRMYIELFINKLENPSPGCDADIQSGSYILHKDIFREFDFSKVKLYGGELAMFKFLRKRKIDLNFINMKIQSGNSRLGSNYSINQIIETIIKEPLQKSLVHKTLELCFYDYKKHIKNQNDFKNEVTYYLQ